jgi:hypothetical protein
MRNFTRSTGNKSFDYYTRKQAEIIQFATVLKSRTDVTGAVRPGVKYYLPANSIILSKMTIGIIYFDRANNTAPEISDVYPYPVPSVTAGSLGLDLFLTLTLCDDQGVILFNRIPLPDLIATLRKVKPYTGKICTFKSYFQLTNAPVVSTPDSIVVNLAFYLV